MSVEKNFIRSRDGRILIWEYDKLCVLGIQCTLETPLGELYQLFDDGSIEFAPVKTEPGRDFLAASHLFPPIDVKIARGHHYGGSIVTSSLNKEKAKQITHDIMVNAGAATYGPDQDFIETVEQGLVIERTSYEACAQISRLLNADLEKVFGAMHYGNFLKQYKEFSEDESLRYAAERFGLSLAGHDFRT